VHGIDLRRRLQDLKKREMSAVVYFNKLKALTDELATAGKPMDDDDIINAVLNGLDADYNPLAEAVSARIDQGITLGEVYAMLLAAEARIEAQNADTGGGGFSANLASKGGFGRGNGGGYRGGGNGGSPHRDNYGRGNGHNGGYGGGYRANGGGGGYNRNGGGNRYNNNGGGGGNNYQGNKPRYTGPPCQICHKPGHPADKCLKRFNKSYVTPEQPQVNAATTEGSYGGDPHWYIDTGANEHVTGELEKLAIRDRYHGNEQVHTASGQGMEIEHIGHTSINTSDRPIHLNNILHVPNAHKSLASASKLTLDNHAYVEIHPTFFSLKDKDTGRIILQGESRNGLYPMHGASSDSSKQLLSASSSKPSSTRWHGRLGHPSFSVVEQVIRTNKLPVSNKHDESICDAC
jgi:histone deacetylase 1/2